MIIIRCLGIIGHARSVRAAGLLALVLAGLASCGGSGDSSPPGAQNAPPTISGSAAGTAVVGVSYSFQPGAQDPEHATLAFSITHKPSWASFNTANGALAGTPQQGDVGTTSNIVISVSDGENTVSLAAFSIAVVQATASAQLSWTAPTTNTDGSALTDLAGFRVYYGPTASTLSTNIDVPDAQARGYTVMSLAPGIYYFSVSAYSMSGVESDLPTPVMANIQ